MEEKEITYTLRRSNRRTIQVEITQEAEIVVRAPRQMSDQDIEEFLNERRAWIKKHLQEVKKRLADQPPVEKLTERELHKLGHQALGVIPKKVAQYAREMGVGYGQITIRNQKTRWGSCSAKGNLNFNCLLMLAPEEVLNYVIIHELAHRREMNHSRAFWNIVSEQMPDYKEKIRWLNEHGDELMRRNPKRS